MHKLVRVVTLSALFASLGVLVPYAPASAATTARDISQFACGPGDASPFTDIAGTTHAASIACIVSYGLASGTTASTYEPGRAVTRGQMTTFLANFIDLVGSPVGTVPPTPPGEPIGPKVYSDVDGNTHEENIYYLTDLGIAKGTSDTTFSPNLPVTRGQMATFLVRTMEFLGFVPPAGAPDAFTDDQGGTHEAASNAVAALGIAQGTASGIYQPGAAVTRGAMATFLARMLDLGIESGFAIPFIITEALAALTGTEVVPGPGATGTATAYIATTDIEDVLCFEVIGAAGATEIHVHAGADGANGPSVAAIPVPSGDAAIGCLKSTAAGAIAADPEGHYVEIHTAGFPNGATRGQLGSIVSSASALMTGGEVVPGPGSPDALGFASAVTTTQPDVLCVATFAFVFDDTITEVHLHQGALHTNGPEVMDIPITAGPVVYTWGCVVSPSAAALATDPGGFYVDALSTAFPAGVLRGQLAAD